MYRFEHGSIVPFIITFPLPLLGISTDFSSNVASHPWSHSVPMDSKSLLSPVDVIYRRTSDLKFSCRKKWRSFLWMILPIHIEWDSSIMPGDNPPMYYFTCTHRCSPQSISQELWTQSLVYFARLNLTCTSVCVGIVYFSATFVQNEDILFIKYGFTTMIAQCPNRQKGLIESWKMCFSCLNLQVLLRKEWCMSWRDDFPVWRLDGERIDGLFLIVAWRVESQIMSRCSCVRHC